MDLIVLDPGFHDLHSHHFRVNQLIDARLTRSDVAVLTVASSCLDVSDNLIKDISVLPFFKTPCYVNDLEALAAPEQELLAESFWLELEELFRQGIIKRESNLLIHTGFSFHYYGLTKFLSYQIEHYSGKAVLCCMFFPGLSVDQGKVRIVDMRSFLQYRNVLAMLNQVSRRRHSHRLLLASGCRTYCDSYQELWPGSKVLLHPSVLFSGDANFSGEGISAGAALYSEPKKRRIIMYLGGPKADKGISFAANLTIAACEQFPDTEFMFQFNRAAPGASQFDEIDARLDSAANRFSNLVLVKGRLSTADFELQLQESDCVLFSYDPRFYKYKTSGILWDAIRYDHLAVISAEGTWVLQESMLLGCQCFAFSYGSIQSAITVIGDFLGSRSGSCDPASPYRECINTEFSEWLLAQLQ